MRNQIVKNLKLFLSFSFEGEDKLLFNILSNKGKFLNIGFNKPILNNNTYLLYLRGWSGLNVDFSFPLTSKIFRHRDKFKKAIVTGDGREVYCYHFLQSAIDTINQEIMEQRIKEGFTFLGSSKLSSICIDELSDNYDLFDLDVEGTEGEILRAMEFKPKVCIIENKICLEVDKIMEQKGYKKIAQSLSNGIYKSI